MRGLQGRWCKFPAKVTLLSELRLRKKLRKTHTPIAHDQSIESPLIAEKDLEEVVVLRGVGSVEAIVPARAKGISGTRQDTGSWKD